MKWLELPGMCLRARFLFIVFATVNIAACSQVASLISPLLKPSVSTELTALRAGDYRIDKSHATVLFKVGHLGLSTYVGRFNSFDATMRFDPENVSNSELDAVVTMESVDCNDSSMENTLRSSDWFNTKRFPTARFISQSARKQGDDSIVFEGTLRWREHSRPITLTGTFNGGALNRLNGKYTLGFSGSTVFKRSDFEVDQYLSLVDDEIHIEVYAEFQRQ
ncbi:polyisoprenoid-binding protein [bacterium]|nr:polyisoprenoid-binding protein [bacterium]